MQFVREWRLKNHPGMNWNEAVKRARKDYYEMKEDKIETLYSKKADKNDKRAFELLKRSGADMKFYEFEPANKKGDKGVYLVEAELVDKDDLKELKDKIQSKRGEAKFKKEAMALMNLPVSERAVLDPKAKIKRRPVGIKKVAKIKKGLDRVLLKQVDKKQRKKLERMLLNQATMGKVKGLKLKQT